MAVSNPSIAFDNTSTATFRAWGLAVSTALAAVGLTKAGDTGQVDWTTVVYNNTANVSSGYEIWRLNDGLHSTRPIYMKIEFGCGPSGQPTIWTQFSTSTNGAGTLNALLTSTRRMYHGDGNATPVPCYFASDGSFLTMVLGAPNFTNGLSRFAAALCFDRSRDSANIITNEGFHWCATSTISSGVVARYSAIPHNTTANGGVFTYFSHGVFALRINQYGEVGNSAGSTPSIYTGCAFFQIPMAPASATYLGDTTFFPQLVTCPSVVHSSVLMAGYTADLPPNYQTVTVPVLGATRTYLTLPLDFSGLGTSNIRTLARYE